MLRIIATLAFMLFISILGAMNQDFSTSLDIFGLKLDGVPISVVASLCFAAGAGFSIIVLLFQPLRWKQKRRTHYLSQGLGKMSGAFQPE